MSVQQSSSIDFLMQLFYLKGRQNKAEFHPHNASKMGQSTLYQRSTKHHDISTTSTERPREDLNVFSPRKDGLVISIGMLVVNENNGEAHAFVKFRKNRLHSEKLQTRFTFEEIQWELLIKTCGIPIHFPQRGL